MPMMPRAQAMKPDGSGRERRNSPIVPKISMDAEMESFERVSFFNITA